MERHVRLLFHRHKTITNSQVQVGQVQTMNYFHLNTYNVFTLSRELGNVNIITTTNKALGDNHLLTHSLTHSLFFTFSFYQRRESWIDYMHSRIQ